MDEAEQAYLDLWKELESKEPFECPACGKFDVFVHYIDRDDKIPHFICFTCGWCGLWEQIQKKTNQKLMNLKSLSR